MNTESNLMQTCLNTKKGLQIINFPGFETCLAIKMVINQNGKQQFHLYICLHHKQAIHKKIGDMGASRFNSQQAKIVIYQKYRTTSHFLLN